jgi:hypothetical protein
MPFPLPNTLWRKLAPFSAHQFSMGLTINIERSRHKGILILALFFGSILYLSKTSPILSLFYHKITSMVLWQLFSPCTTVKEISIHRLNKNLKDAIVDQWI